MKLAINKLLLATSLLVPAFFASAQKQSYTVKAKVANFGAPSKAYLNYSLGSSSVLDSVLIVNGNFEFSGTVEQPIKARILISPEGKRTDISTTDVIPVYLEQGMIRIVAADIPARAAVTGTPLNDVNQELRSKTDPWVMQVEEVRQQYIKIMDTAEKQQRKLMKEFIDSHPKSVVTVDVIYTYAGAKSGVEELEQLYARLDPVVKASSRGKDLSTRIAGMKQTKVGALAPDFVQADTSGKMVRLGDFKGKYVLIDFWASWCVPCRQENPNVVKAYQKYKDKNFTVIGVSLDAAKQRQDWLAAIKKDGLSWTQVSDLQGWSNEVAKKYDIKSIPQNFLISPEGKVLAVNLRGEALDAKLKEFL